MRKALCGTAAVVLGLAGGVFAATQPAIAHHSFALFDGTKSVSLQGTVKKFEWTNPHSWITLDVIGPQNMVDEWIIELPSAGVLAREGWNRNFVKVGEKLILRVNPLKNGAKGGSLQSFIPESRTNSAP